MKTMIGEYLEMVRATDRFSEKEVQPILLGLYGEVGSVMSAVKKFKREDRAYTGLQDQVVEELGDAFWYLSALSMKIGAPLEEFIDAASNENDLSADSIPRNDPDAPIALSPCGDRNVSYSNLIEIGKAATALLESCDRRVPDQPELVRAFILPFLRLLTDCGVRLDKVLKANSKKAISRFNPCDLEKLPDFDADFPEYEQLPRDFRIEIHQRDDGRVCLQMNDVFIGDPLTDSISKEDGFRYHDVIHLSHVAILHWSPTIRALLKRKRKSKRDIDEAQDGGRSIVVEEGLVAWVFSKAKELEYFEGHDGVSYDLLKTIQEFVRGYEVEKCPLWLWERCILEGYKVFRCARESKGGIIVGDRRSRTLRYERLS